MRAHHGGEARALDGTGGIESSRATGAQELDAAEQLLRRLRAVARELRDAPIARRRLERLDRIDPECLVQLENLRRAEAGNAQEVEQASGCRGAQLLEVGRLARLDQIT